MPESKQSFTSREVAALVCARTDGDPASAASLLPLVYEELRRLAAKQLRRERETHTLQPTALVHEAYLRLVDADPGGWADRTHFVALGVLAMRRVLVDHARRKSAQKRGGLEVSVVLHPDAAVDQGHGMDVLELEGLLQRLERVDARQARLVELRFYGEVPMVEIAAILGVSERTAKRDWRDARAWLLAEMTEPEARDS